MRATPQPRPFAAVVADEHAGQLQSVLRLIDNGLETGRIPEDADFTEAACAKLLIITAQLNASVSRVHEAVRRKSRIHAALQSAPEQP